MAGRAVLLAPEIERPPTRRSPQYPIRCFDQTGSGVSLIVTVQVPIDTAWSKKTIGPEAWHAAPLKQGPGGSKFAIRIIGAEIGGVRFERSVFGAYAKVLGLAVVPTMPVKLKRIWHDVRPKQGSGGKN